MYDRATIPDSTTAGVFAVLFHEHLIRDEDTALDIAGLHIHESYQWILWLVLAAIVVLIAVVGVSNSLYSRPFQKEATSSAKPEEVIDSLESVLSSNGWNLDYRDTGTLVMSTDRAFAKTAAIGRIARNLSPSTNKRVSVEFDVTESSRGAIIVANGNQSGNGAAPYIGCVLDSLPR